MVVQSVSVFDLYSAARGLPRFCDPARYAAPEKIAQFVIFGHAGQCFSIGFFSSSWNSPA